MQWASALSTQEQPLVAVQAVLGSIQTQLMDDQVSLVLIFASGHSKEAWPVFLESIRKEYLESTIVGCGAAGVVGGGREVENSVALSVTAAVLPDVAVIGFHYEGQAVATVNEAAQNWIERLGVEAEHRPAFMVFPDPYTCDPAQLIAGLDRAYPGQVKVGGLASGGHAAGEQVLVLDDRVEHAGAVGVAMYGDIDVSSIVAQGCRPVGNSMVVTECRKNLLVELDGVSALEQLERVFQLLDPQDQHLFRSMPMVGVGMDKTRETYRQGDFLLRQLMGMDRKNGFLSVGTQLEVGNIVQFHLRDAESSRTELEELLIQHGRNHSVDEGEGAVLFSCVGRGESFFGVPDHDVSVATRYLGGAPIGGFFGAGEVGPVDGRTWLHGYTCAIGIFRPRGWS
jgi:small ligand-binding sensory domain FIST